MNAPSKTILKKDRLIYYQFYNIKSIIDKNKFSKLIIDTLPIRVSIYIPVDEEEYKNIEHKALDAKIYKNNKYRATYHKFFDEKERIKFVEDFLKDDSMVNMSRELSEKFDNNSYYLLSESVSCMPQNNSQSIMTTYSRTLELLSTYLTNDNMKELKHTTIDKIEKDINKKYTFNPVESNKDCKLSKNKSWAKSKTKKMNDLFSFNNFKDEKEIDFWVYGEKRSMEEHHIKKDRLINPYEKYVAEWITIDENGDFEFLGVEYSVGGLWQYVNTGQKENTYRLQYKMDKVLCFEQFGVRYFFSEDIDEIEPLVINN